MVSLDGKHKTSQPYTMLAILPASEEVPWSGPNSFQEKFAATLHTSWESGQMVIFDCDSVDWTVGEHVFKVVY
jgi:hypothetical protein